MKMKKVALKKYASKKPTEKIDSFWAKGEKTIAAIKKHVYKKSTAR